ncbi:MAG TPA: serine/threonine-protein kinase [Vicinamibacteria bacterium]|nr:serine/threonine-protein kinase [Vicinamibacteria bacterium]
MADTTVVGPLDALHQLCLADGVWAERYEGWTELGRGGSASVVRTFSRATGEDIALKVFHHLAPEDEQRFRQEVRSAQRLTSPHIVRTYGAFPRGRLAWIEMELVDGPDLRRELDRRAVDGTPFDLESAFAIASALTQALATAHEAGVVHRDVKPGNVLLPASGRPIAKLGDFGLSRVAGSTRVTATGLLAGTPQFVAPEIIAGRPATPAADVYSLALTLYLVFSGNRSPYGIGPDASPAEWLRAHSESRPRPLRDHDPRVPAGVAQLVAEGLAKEPAARPNIAHFSRELRAIASGAHTSGGLVVPRDGSRRRVLAIAAVALGLVAAVTVGRLWSERDPKVALAVAPSAASGPPATTLAAPAFRYSVDGGLLSVVNAGDAGVTDLRVVVYDEGGAVHDATATGILRSGEEVMLPLDGFAPPLAMTTEPGRVTIQPAGGPVQEAVRAARE